MSDLIELINKLEVTTSFEEKPYVFWTENMMYIDDNSGHNFTLQTDLYYAWKFAHIFDLDLDYDASDDEVLKLGELIVSEYNDCDDFYLIDVDEYFNDIQRDFNEVLGLKWNDTDWQQVKRNIIQQIENNVDEIGVGGSATFIAKWLYDTINDRIVYEKHEYPNENKSLLLDLRNTYLSTDSYDIEKFAKGLHNKMNEEKLFDKWISDFTKDYADTVEAIDWYIERITSYGGGNLDLIYQAMINVMTAIKNNENLDGYVGFRKDLIEELREEYEMKQ